MAEDKRLGDMDAEELEARGNDPRFQGPSVYSLDGGPDAPELPAHEDDEDDEAE